MLNVNLSRQASKFLKKLPAKQTRQIATKIMELRVNPNVHDSIQLKGYPEYRRTDLGEYRIIYNVDDDVLNVFVIGKRNDDEVYKIFQRKI